MDRIDIVPCVCIWKAEKPLSGNLETVAIKDPEESSVNVPREAEQMTGILM